MKKAVGLVLSGGGARGAYQVGVIKALAEMGVRVDAVSGASVGALNGAVLSASRSMEDGVERLTKLWQMLAEKPPFGGDTPTLVRLLEAAGLEIPSAARNTAAMAKEIGQNLFPAIKSPETAYLVDNSSIKKLLHEYVTHDQLQEGLPLYVSIFPNRDLLESVVGYGLAVLGLKDTPKSKFVHIQSLAAEDQQKALLASAAIPFLLEAQNIDGEIYSDGGMGGRLSVQGNTPIEPLAENGYKTLIVTSLSGRKVWKETAYPGVTLFRINRKLPGEGGAGLPDALDSISFDPKKIRTWIAQGYADTLQNLTPHIDVLGCV